MKTPGVHSSLFGVAALAFAFVPDLRAADHRDSPTVGPDLGADLGDVYAFLDPNANTKVILIGTVNGFIVPGEAGNAALFDPTARFTFAIENTGDSNPDLFIDLRFSPRTRATDGSFHQTASVSLRGTVPKDFRGKAGQFDPVDVYQPTLAGTPNPQAPFIFELNNDKNPTTNIQFFAGETDDPFFFDVVAFSRFVGKVLAGDTSAGNEFSRARDTFAGYNTLSIALSVPSSLLLDAKPKRGVTPPTKIGVELISARGSERTVKGAKVGAGAFQQVDRAGVPGVNTAFIAYNNKNAYNGASTVDDGKGAFLGDIAATLGALGTDSTNTVILASVVGLPPGLAPTKKPAEFGTGDFLRLETDSTLAPNSGLGGGTGANGFPNGRRLADDVIDTILFFVANQNALGDNVNANDVPLQNTFPFVPLPQQPRASGVLDDNTRN